MKEWEKYRIVLEHSLPIKVCLGPRWGQHELLTKAYKHSERIVQESLTVDGVLYGSRSKMKGSHYYAPCFVLTRKEMKQIKKNAKRNKDPYSAADKFKTVIHYTFPGITPLRKTPPPLPRIELIDRLQKHIARYISENICYYSSTVECELYLLSEQDMIEYVSLLIS